MFLHPPVFAMKMKLLAALCAATLLSTPAFAADDGTDSSVTTLKEVQAFVVQRDGSFTLDHEILVRLNEQRAVGDQAQRQFHFNRTLEDIDIVEAYTEKPDGRRIQVQPDQIKLQQEPAYSGAPMFQDMQVKSVIYPDVAVGDKLYSKIRHVRRTAMFPGQFTDATYPLFRPTTQLTLIYDLPSDMKLRADDPGFKASAPQRHDDRTVYRWDYQQADNPRIESDTIAYADYGRHLFVSTFNDFAEVGLAYDHAAAVAATPTARITAKARELTQGLSDPRAQALAIDNWVRKNIRYVAVYIGNGGLEPHNAEAVLDNRYGDCKDHATLMEALLRAVGIDSTPVLINAGNSYKLAPVASLGQFNHAINYIPSLDLYLDSTAENISAGYLPVWDLDKTVILTRSGKLGHTPVTQLGKIKNRYTVRIADDGSARFDFTRDQLGWWEEEVRYEQRNWRKEDQQRFVESLLKTFGVKGSGDVLLGDLDDKTAGHGYSYSLRGQGENWVYLPGTVGVSTSSSLYIGLAQQVFGLTNEATRTQPFVCPENDYEEQATYEFPQRAALLAVPPDVHIASPYFQYRAEFKQVDGKLLIARSFKSGKAGTKVCTPEDYVAMQADIKKMVRDLRSQFILQVPEMGMPVTIR
jgi:transglutaminase-like putative cysteine protease